jgi:hypothetical protein
MKITNVTLEVAGAFVVLPTDDEGFAQWPIELRVNDELKTTFFDMEEAQKLAKKWFEHMEYSTVLLEQECIERGNESEDDRIVMQTVKCLKLPSFDSAQDAIRYLTTL